jgi:hypothetical protein
VCHRMAAPTNGKLIDLESCDSPPLLTYFDVRLVMKTPGAQISIKFLLLLKLLISDKLF